jgi:uncharacterized protein
MNPLGILLISGGHERAHYALVLATAAAALGRPVTLFATNGGLRLLLAERPLEADAREAAVEAAGVAGIRTLLDAAQDLGVALWACEAGRRSEGLDEAGLLNGVEVTGAVSFLTAATGQVITL